MISREALKDYTGYGVNKNNRRRVFQERWYRIKHSLQNLSGHALQKFLDDLNEDIKTINEEIQARKAEIQRLKGSEWGDSKFFMYGSAETQIGWLKEEIEDLKDVKRWLLREKGLLTLEINKRKLASVKKPLLKRKAQKLRKEAEKLLKQLAELQQNIKAAVSRLQQIRVEYGATTKAFQLINFDENDNLPALVIDIPYEIEKVAKEPVLKKLLELIKILNGGDLKNEGRS